MADHRSDVRQDVAVFPPEGISRFSVTFPSWARRPRESCAPRARRKARRFASPRKRRSIGTSSVRVRRHRKRSRQISRRVDLSLVKVHFAMHHRQRNTKRKRREREKERKKEGKEKKRKRENERLRSAALVSYVLARSDFHWSRAISHLPGFDKCDARRDKSAFALTGQIDLETDGKKLPTPS